MAEKAKFPGGPAAVRRPDGGRSILPRSHSSVWRQCKNFSWPGQSPSVASTGAWSLVPTSARTLQVAAPAATGVLART